MNREGEVLLIGIFILIICFWGEPDLIDSIITFLQGK